MITLIHPSYHHHVILINNNANIYITSTCITSAQQRDTWYLRSDNSPNTSICNLALDLFASALILVARVVLCIGDNMFHKPSLIFSTSCQRIRPSPHEIALQAVQGKFVHLKITLGQNVSNWSRRH